MKILIIQLARLGDIYMTWPAIRGLRRTYPEAEIHLLTRPRFEAAVKGLAAVDHHWSMPVSNLLEPLVQEEPHLEESLGRIDGFVNQVKGENFDWVINFTFSPMSSYLTHLVAGENCKVTGYSRFSDGYLNFADEVSAYFYAQVGVDNANRIHLADIFASMIDLQYVDSDWQAPQTEGTDKALPDRYAVLHVGASEAHKSLTAAQWIRILNQVHFKTYGLSLVLVGSSDEKAVAENIIKSVMGVSIVNLVGETHMTELFSILQEAEMLIGCDSAPIHMASLTDTPTFNVSVGKVNFWETGPKATLSFIYRVPESEALKPLEVAQVLNDLFKGKVDESLIIRASGMVSYERKESLQERFQWSLIQAIYMGGAYPLADRMEIIQAAAHLRDLNSFAIDQVSLVPEKGLATIGPLLDQTDEVIKSIARQVPDLSPLIHWYQSEKIRIGPGKIEEICAATLKVHRQFAGYLQAYIPDQLLQEEAQYDGTL